MPTLPGTTQPLPPQAIDDQMEQLAAGAAKALGSLWGGLGAVARTVTTHVETATQEVAKELAKEMGGMSATAPLHALRSTAEQLTTSLEKGLEVRGGLRGACIGGCSSVATRCLLCLGNASALHVPSPPQKIRNIPQHPKPPPNRPHHT